MPAGWNEAIELLEARDVDAVLDACLRKILAREASEGPPVDGEAEGAGSGPRNGEAERARERAPGARLSDEELAAFLKP